MTAYEELVSILSTFTPEQMNKFCAKVTAYYAGNTPDATQRLLDFLPVYMASKQVSPPRKY